MADNENYKTVVRYYNTRIKQNQKYITIEIPDDSILNEDDQVSVTITKMPEGFVSTPTTQNKRRITAGSIMREMNVGDTATFGIKQWITVRSIATQIKRLYGSKYSVRKDKRHPDTIVVTRLK